MLLTHSTAALLSFITLALSCAPTVHSRNGLNGKVFSRSLRPTHLPQVLRLMHGQQSVDLAKLEFVMLWDDMKSRASILRPKCSCLPCLAGWRDPPKKMAVRVHQLWFSKSVFLKTKCGAMLLQISQNNLKAKNREFDLMCSADP